MTAPDAAALEAAVRAEDAALVRDLLKDATEADRRALATALKPLRDGPKWEPPAPVVFTHLAEGTEFIFGQMMARMRAEPEPEPSAAEQAHQDWWQLTKTPAFAAFRLGVAGGPRPASEALDECHGRDYHVSDAEYEALAGVLADRDPPWLAELIERRLASELPLGLPTWPLAWRLVRLGAIARPASPDYGVKMVGALLQDPPVDPPLRPGEGRYEPAGYDGPRRRMTGTGGDQLAAVLRARPDLLKHELWRLFTDPGVGKEMERYSFATSWDKLAYGDQWADGLVELAAGHDLDRGRLLDECLAAFLRDFPPNHVGWYAALHGKLAPSPDEQAARSPAYLALLAANSKVGVSLGQRACAELLTAGRLDPRDFLAASGAALAFPQKSVATLQLKLIAQLAAPNPAALRDLALATAAQAFAHERPDVQSAALKLITRYGLPADEALRASVIDLAAALSPVLQPDATALGLTQPQQSVPPSPVPLPPQSVSSSAPLAPQAIGASPVAPVTDPDELIRLLAQLMEDATDPLAVERALAGAVRLCVLPLADRKEIAAPLQKRARKQGLDDYGGPFSGQAVRADIGWLAVTWATGKLPPASTMEARGWGRPGDETPWQARRPATLSAILSTRIGEACILIAIRESGPAPAVPLLAEPEFSDGTISPAELAAREALWAAAGLAPYQYDREVAHLRTASGAAGELAFEPSVALETVRYHETPWGDRHEFTEDRAAIHAGLRGSPESVVAPSCWPLLTALEHSADDRRYAVHRSGVRLDEMVAAWPLLCPHDSELLAAHLLSPLSDALGAGRNAGTTALRGLGVAPGAFGPIGHLALVTGLSGAAADVRIAAADAWMRVALSGRLDPARAAGAIDRGVRSGALKLSRIAEGLRHAAADPAAAPSVTPTCVLATAALADVKPAGLHLLLELAAELTAVSGSTMDLPAPITQLAAGKGTSKLAAAARRLAAPENRTLMPI